MLTSYPSLEPAFCHPVSAPSISPEQCCLQTSWSPGYRDHCTTLLWWTEDQHCCKGGRPSTPPPTSDEGMELATQPEEDLRRLADNELKLRLSGYYYGNLGWLDASHILRQCRVGTFLLRDSEHNSYLYTLSVQTNRGPTSCRIEYRNGRFRLDSSEDLRNKMPRFDYVTELVEHYVYLTRNIPVRKEVRKQPVWLDMDEENSSDVPVQIYQPLYRGVRSLQHLCRVTVAKTKREGLSSARTVDESVLPTVLKNYLREYPYSQ